MKSNYYNRAVIITKGETTPLHVAARRGDVDAVAHLLKTGACHIDARDGRAGWTALLHAIDAGHTSIVELLLENGAYTGQQTADDDDPHGWYDENIWIHPGMTALHHAAKRCRIDIIKLLLKNGIDVNEKNDVNQRSALSYALTSVGHTEEQTAECICFLVEQGADVNNLWSNEFNEDWAGDTPLMTAIISYPLLCKFLIEHGANVNGTDDNGTAPLHRAVDMGHVDLVKLLLEKGADVNHKNLQGETALHWTNPRCRDYHYIVSLLVTHGARQWEYVPCKCRGLGLAILPVWKETPEDMPHLVARLPEEDQRRVGMVLYQYLLKSEPSLPSPMYTMIINRVFDINFKVV